MRFFPTITITLILIIATGCESMQGLLENAPKPTASIKSAALEGLSLDAAQMRFDIEVKNPYAVALPVTKLAYGLSSGDASFLSGETDSSASIPAKGSQVIPLHAKVTFADLLKAVSGVKPGSVVPYKIDTKLTADAPGVGPLTLPLSKQGELPVPAVPKVELQDVKFTSLTFSKAEAVLRMNVTNTNDFAVDLNELGYSLSLGGTPVASGGVSKAAKFAKGAANTIEVPVSFAPSNLGLAAFNMLLGDGASYDLTGVMKADTPFGALDMPYQRRGDTVFKR